MVIAIYAFIILLLSVPFYQVFPYHTPDGLIYVSWAYLRNENISSSKLCLEGSLSPREKTVLILFSHS